LKSKDTVIRSVIKENLSVVINKKSVPRHTSTGSAESARQPQRFGIL